MDILTIPIIYGINGVNTTDESAHEVTLQQRAMKKNKCRNDALQLMNSQNERIHAVSYKGEISPLRSR